jgi:hypothetical protein
VSEKYLDLAGRIRSFVNLVVEIDGKVEEGGGLIIIVVGISLVS